MSNSTDPPINLSVWRKKKSAPKSELWKWAWDTWDPVIHRIYGGGMHIQELECPVCGVKELYAYFLAVAFDIPSSEAEGRRVYVADRWYGCHNCQTQVRERGHIPRWVKDEDVRWATEELRKRAEQKLARSGIKLLKGEEDEATNAADSSKSDVGRK